MMRAATLMSLVALAACAGDGSGNAAAAAAPAGDLLLGRQVAERGCGGCHAVAGGASAASAAPAFADLHRRYGVGGLDALLAEGMIAPADRAGEEGSRYAHPHMPAVVLQADELAALRAYLRSLEPAR